MEMLGHAHHRAADFRSRAIGIEPQVRQVIEDCVESPGHLDSREMLADADVWAACEGPMRLALAEDIETVRLGIEFRIAIGCRCDNIDE